MAKKAKTFRKKIRINGQLVTSPSFPTLAMAEAWYNQMKDHKTFIKFGMISGKVPTFLEYSAKWIQKRMATHPQSTWGPDDQRLRDYLLPHLANERMDKITRPKMRAILQRIVTEEGRSIGTRTLVKALASKLFTDALNEDPPLLSSNPVAMLKFDDARKGKKKPMTLEDSDEILRYLKAARSVSDFHFVLACLGVMAGFRKGEMIALRWSNVKPKRMVVEAEAHCDQWTLSIKPGTKGGCNETREVHCPAELFAVLNWYRAKVRHSQSSDFILHDEKGDWIRPRAFHKLVCQISEKFGRHLSPHKLRHTYGRHFAARTGNLQALQQMLGHKSLSTTQIYSELSGRQLSDFREATAVGVSEVFDND